MNFNKKMPSLLKDHLEKIMVLISILISVNITFFLYNFFKWQEGYWAIVSIAAVVSADFKNTFGKMILRIIGTLAGAAYSYAAVQLFSNYPLLLVLFLAFGILIASSISAESTTLAYGGIVANITMIMIIATSIAYHADFNAIAIDRTLQVCLGIIIMATVNMILLKAIPHFKHTPIALRATLSEISNGFKALRLKKTILYTASKIVIASALTFLPWLYFQYPGGFWATISCFFIIEESLSKTQSKALLRFVAHVFAASFGLAAALLLGNDIRLLSIPLTLGLMACGYVIALKKNYSSIGNTMGIALSVMLLADPGTSGSIHIILTRFINVLLGIAIGILITHGLRFGAKK